MSIFKKKDNGQDYISAAESRKISRDNRRITDRIEKQRNRKHVPPEEYMTTMRDPKNVAEFDNLHTYFFTDIGTVKAVDGVTFDIPQGKTVGVVGESGCGKSTIAAVLTGRVSGYTGHVTIGGQELSAVSEASLLKNVTLVSLGSHCCFAKKLKRL